MRTSASTQTRDVLLLALGVFIVTVTACLLVGPGSVPFLEDNQHYYFMAERAASGVPPHVSNFDPKHALAPLLSAVGITIGRTFGASDVIAARGLSILVFGLSAALLAALTFRLTSSRLAAATAGLALPTFRYLLLMATMGVRPKVYLIFFMVATMYAVTRRQWKVAGLSSGLGFLCWQPGAIVMVVVLATMRIRGHPARHMAAVAGAAAAPVLVYEGYFLIVGGLASQLVQSYVFPALYMHGELMSPVQVLGTLTWLWTSGYGWNILPFLAVVGLGILVYRAISTSPDPFQLAARQPGWAVFTGTMFLAAAFTYYDHQGPPDLFFVLPFVATLSGIAVQHGKAAASSALGAIPSSIMSVLVVIPLLLGIAWTVRSVKAELPYDLQDQKRLAHNIVSRRGEPGSVYALGRTMHLMALRHRSNWISYSQFFRGVAGYLRDRGVRTPFVPCKQGQLPEVILFRAGHHPPGWPEWLKSNYRPHELPGFKSQQIQIWHLAGIPQCFVNLPTN